MGVIGYVVKVIHIPINNILVYVASPLLSSRTRYTNRLFCVVLQRRRVNYRNLFYFFWCSFCRVKCVYVCVREWNEMGALDVEIAVVPQCKIPKGNWSNNDW